MNEHSTNFFNTFTQLNVLIVGDAMIDRYLTGSVNRISPEAPVPVVHLTKTEDRLGGAANVALNIRALGATPYLCSVVGKDSNSTIFKNLMNAADMPTIGIVESKERITTVKTRVLARYQQLLRIDEEVKHDLSEKETNTILKRIKQIIKNENINTILLQDYNKGVLSTSTISSIIAIAQKNNVPVAVDPKFKHFYSYKNIQLFKPNLVEVSAKMPFKVSPTDKNTLRKAAQRIRKKLNNYYTLITLSEYGMYLDTPEAGIIIPTHPRNIIDVSGAGDTVLSVIALGLAINGNFKTIVQLANLAGGIVCESIGVVPIDKSKLQQEFERMNIT